MFVLDFESIKGAAHPIYFPPSALFPSRLFKCELFGLSSLEHNGTRWSSAFGAQIAKIT